MNSNLNLSWVTPQLAVGGAFPMDAAVQLSRQLGIARVVDARLEAVDDERVLRAHGIALLHLPTLDRCAVSQQLLGDGVSWVNAQLGCGHRVYLHCERGIGRSALLALCVLVSRGSPPLEALLSLKDARAQVSPSPGQLESFRSFCDALARARPRPWSTPGFDALARIAYRHLAS